MMLVFILIPVFWRLALIVGNMTPKEKQNMPISRAFMMTIKSSPSPQSICLNAALRADLPRPLTAVSYALGGCGYLLRDGWE